MEIEISDYGCIKKNSLKYSALHHKFAIVITMSNIVASFFFDYFDHNKSLESNKQ